MTPGAEEALTPAQMIALLQRHRTGDWGTIDAEDRALNNASVANFSRLLSAYPIDQSKPADADNTVWIITEADRSVTTILLPSEY